MHELSDLDGRAFYVKSSLDSVERRAMRDALTSFREVRAPAAELPVGLLALRLANCPSRCCCSRDEREMSTINVQITPTFG